MRDVFRASSSGTPATMAAIVLVVAMATILAALAFEHLGGYAPCPLCLQQRYAYYAGIPLAAAAMLAAHRGAARSARLMLGLVGIGFLVNASLGVYHSGVEWHWWPGPDTCGTLQAIGTSVEDLRRSLDSTRVIRCDEAAWRFLGLSFAGWNAIVSALLAGIAAVGVFARRRP